MWRRLCLAYWYREQDQPLSLRRKCLGSWRSPSDPEPESFGQAELRPVQIAPEPVSIAAGLAVRSRASEPKAAARAVSSSRASEPKEVLRLSGPAPICRP